MCGLKWNCEKLNWNCEDLEMMKDNLERLLLKTREQAGNIRTGVGEQY